MEGESETYEEVKPKAAGEEVKKGEEVTATNNNNNKSCVVNVNENMGSCKEGLDLLEKKGVHLWHTSPRPTSKVTSETNTTIPTPDQLTIFYGGSVVVFDGIPAEKACEIMLIAATAAAAVKPGDVKNTGSVSPASTPVLTRSTSMQSTASALASPQAQLYPVHKSSLCNLQAELPIARRHSLQRFFEKRRDRLVSKSPYPTSSAAKMAESTKPDVSAGAALDVDCFEKPIATEEEVQPKAVTNLA